MKRLEATLPDALIRQVLMLIAESASEFHVYDVAQEQQKQLVQIHFDKKISKSPPPPKPASPPPPTVSQAIHAYIRDKGPSLMDNLRRDLVAAGYNKNSVQVQANKDLRDGKLTKTDQGFYYLKQEAAKTDDGTGS